ncbi:MAG: FAD-dependent oxidoreductase [Opitutales bacterium]|nr:FAD-dependent oxidoreductase [Opitutales bacterium]
MESFEVVVFGATPGGMAAACSAAEQGARTLLLEPSDHVGGHLSSGICTTEIEHMLPESFRGWMLRFLREIGQRYGVEGPLHRWEPHVAEAVFEEMLADAGVVVRRGTYPEKLHGESNQIRHLVLSDGSTVTGRVWIDASYEGDLMAMAKVPYTVGRESRETYGESLAGMRFIEDISEVRNTKGHAEKVDSVWEADLRTADGGWVPGVETGVVFTAGTGDGKVMNYHYRVTVTKAANRIPFPCPEGFDEGRFELLARYFHKYPDSSMRRIVGFINNPSGRYSLDSDGNTVVHEGDKWELNNHQASILSLGHLGGQFLYPDGDRATRQAILRDHYAYNAGLLHFLCQSRSVPLPVREAMNRWGLPPDEYVTNGHWPYQPYIREARRMVGAYVLTERDVLHDIEKEDGIFWNSHWIDCHHVQRIALSDTRFRNEGRIWKEVTRPYAIPYRSLLPPPDSVRNLLVPGCLSASHVAFSSVRLESTWMGLGEAAACAALQLVNGQADCVHSILIKGLQKTLEQRK